MNVSGTPASTDVISVRAWRSASHARSSAPLSTGTEEEEEEVEVASTAGAEEEVVEVAPGTVCEEEVVDSPASTPSAVEIAAAAGPTASSVRRGCSSVVLLKLAANMEGTNAYLVTGRPDRPRTEAFTLE